MDPRHHQTLQEPGRGPELKQATPSRHGGVADHGQGSGEGAVLGGEADGHHVGIQFYWSVELQQSQVTVVGGLVVTGVNFNFEDSSLLLGFLTHIQVIFTFTGTNSS